MNGLTDDDPQRAILMQDIGRMNLEIAELRKERDSARRRCLREVELLAQEQEANARLAAEVARLRETQRWIPVEERLPEPWYNGAIVSDYIQLAYKVKDGEYRGLQCVSRYWTEKGQWEFNGKANGLDALGYEAFAWQPLPPAPTKGGE